MDAKAPGDLVYLLGQTRDELGGSEYYAIHEKIGRNVPKVDAKSALHRYRTVNAAQEEGLLASCHDLSDGGLGVALAETAFAGGFGLEIDLNRVPSDVSMREDKLLYSESASRLLVTIKPENQKHFETLFADQECACIGRVAGDEYLKIIGMQSEILVYSTISDLKEAWQSPLRGM
jgi:phosphoribosylformylglycinamidine synthase